MALNTWGGINQWGAVDSIPYQGELLKQSLTPQTRTLNFSGGYSQSILKGTTLPSFKSLNIVAGQSIGLNKTPLFLASSGLSVSTGTSISFVTDIGKTSLTLNNKLLTFGQTTYPEIPVGRLFVMKGTSNIFIMK